MPEEDKDAIEKFYESHNIKYKGLTTYQQVIVFKRTVNYIFIIAHFFDKKDYAQYVNPMDGKKIGVVRTQGYIFYKDGTLLYEYDYDRQRYDNQVEHRKLLKVSYDLHEKLDNKYLNAIGGSGKSMHAFDSACHNLIKHDAVCKSVDFIKED